MCIQEESGELEKQLAAERGRSRLVQQDLAASLQESKEALHREVDIMAQLEAQDQVAIPPPPSPFPHAPPSLLLAYSQQLRCKHLLPVRSCPQCEQHPSLQQHASENMSCCIWQTSCHIYLMQWPVMSRVTLILPHSCF